MSKRPRNFDFSKSFTRYESFEEFSKLQTHDQVGPIINFNDKIGQQSKVTKTAPSEAKSQQSQQQTQSQIMVPGSTTTSSDQQKKENIITPQNLPIQTVNNTQQQQQPQQSCMTSTLQSMLGTTVNGDGIQKKRKQTCGYIRLRREELLPKADRYELTDIDFEYLNEFNQRNESLNISLPKESFENLISAFELRSGKDTILADNEYQQVIPIDVREKIRDNESLMLELYQYYRKRREMMKRPLLRLFWKANPDDNNPHAAFRPRDKEKMKLRRYSKPNDQEAYLKFKALRDEWRWSHIISMQIRGREYIKHDIVKNNIIKFYQEVIKIDKTVQFQQGPRDSKDMEQLKQSQEKDQQQTLNIIKEGREGFTKVMKKIQHNKNQYFRPTVPTVKPTSNASSTAVATTVSLIPPAVSNMMVEENKEHLDEQNFDVAAFLASVCIEASQNGLSYEKVSNPSMLNSIPKEQSAKQQTLVTQKNNINSETNDLKQKTIQATSSAGTAMQQVSNKMDAGSIDVNLKQLSNHIGSINNNASGQVVGPGNQQFAQPLPLQQQIEKQQLHVHKKNIIQFSIRRRLIRGGLTVIDRFFIDSDIQARKEKDVTKIVKIKECPAFFDNTYLKEKIKRFTKYVVEENNEDSNDDESKAIKKNVSNAMKEFMKKKK